MNGADTLVGLAILVGLVGVFVPMLPGSLLIGAAIVVWGWHTGGTTAWSIVALCLVVLVVGAIVKYVIPGRRLRDAGVPTGTLLAGGVLGIAGLFVVPVVGFVLGFLLGVFVMQWRLLGRDRAWPATWQAVKAIGLGMLIEFSCAACAALIWVIGVVVI